MKNTRQMKTVNLIYSSAVTKFLRNVSARTGISLADTRQILQGSLVGNPLLYPFVFDGKLWDENDCNDVFCAFYYHNSCLNDEGAVHVSGDDWVFPNGKFVTY